jgi:hypothetical protein
VDVSFISQIRRTLIPYCGCCVLSDDGVDVGGDCIGVAGVSNDVVSLLSKSSSVSLFVAIL